MTKKFQIKQTDNIDEAICMALSSAFFFLKYHTTKTLVALMVFFGSSLYVMHDYITSDKINVEKLKPLTSEFSLFPETYADEPRKNPIMINGVYYGENDINYVIYKVKNSPEIIVYNKWLKTGFRYEIPALEDFKQLKRKK